MATKFKQNLDVTGNITLTGQVSAQGNVTLGDTDTDSVTFSADVTSNILPNLTATYDLGADGKAWRTVHTGNLVFEGSNVDGNETTFGVINPTADRTINLPDSTGTVATQEWVNGQGFGAGAGGSINGLNDVDTATVAPSNGQVLKWNGANWIPQNDTASSYTNASVDAHINQSTATNGQVLSWNGSDYAWIASGSGSLSNVVEDTTPQLGGNLDLNSKDITGTGNINITGSANFGSNDITTTGKVLFANVYNNIGDLPSASTYHGMFAHVHGTGAAYYAHAGAWIQLADNSALASYQTTAGLNGAIDTHLNQSNPTSGHVLSWNGSDYAWVANSGGGGGSTSPGGSNTQVQFNDSSSFGGDSDFTYNKTTNTLTVVNLTATNITTTGSGSQTISAGANIELNATNRVLVTDTPFRLASMTTTQRNAISSPVNGDMIYNSTTNQLESYENSAWGATAGSGGGSGDITRVNITAGTGLTGTQDTTTGDHTQTLAVDVGTTANKIVQLDGTAKLPAVDGSQLTNISGSGIASVVADTTPQLGGDLDVNGKTIAHTFNVGNSGASDYTFSDTGNIWFPTTENDPVLYLRRGEQYKFVVNASGHPFQIRTGSGGSAYNTGVTNNGAQVGTIIFKVPMSAPATLYYQCTIHGGMGNTINIV
tara:strand:- start:9115 stop:11082 length:1968 start_codon:yes stop_codon:yes gene_type:complete